MLSAGVPMVTGGDEMYRTQFGDNNVYNLDTDKKWLDYSNAQTFASFFHFSTKLMAFRDAHPAQRPAEFFKGADSNNNGLKDITWLPGNLPGKHWYRVADTADWMESQDNFNAPGREELLVLTGYIAYTCSDTSLTGG
jgi:isoamylase